MRNLKFLLPLFLILLPLKGCVVPDIKPFSSATTQMTSALSEGFNLVQSNLDAAAKLDLESTLKTRLSQKRDSFRLEAAGTRKVLAALDRYAKSLVDVSESGDKGKATRDKIADAIGGITAVIPVTALYSSSITTTLKEINDIASKIRTLKKLEDALDQADLAIQKVASILDEQIITQLIKIDSAAGAILVAYMTNSSQSVTRPYEDFTGRQARANGFVSAILEFETLAARYNQALASKPVDEEKLGRFRKELDRQWGGLAEQDVELSKLAFDPRNLAAMTALLDKRETVWSRRAITPPYFQVRYDKAQLDLATQETLLKQQHEVLIKSQSLLRSWATAHSALKKAVTNAKHSISFQELFDEAQKLKDLIDKLSATSK